jgi:hypothetical protein
MSESSQEKQWVSDVWVVVPHPAEAGQLLVTANGAGAALPHFQLIDHQFPHTGTVNTAVTERFGLQATALRCAADRWDREARHTWTLYTMENHDPHWQPKEGSYWAGRETVTAMELEPHVHTALAAWFDEMASGLLPAERTPWARPGWLAEVQNWIEAQLAPHGYQISGPVQTVKHWGISAVLRAPTDSGDIYFKAMLCPLFAREPAVTQFLGQLFPDLVPTLLAADTGRGWMLLPDFKARNLAELDEAERVKAYPLLATMQIAALNHLDELRTAGAVDRPLATLPADLDALLADEMAMSHLDAADAEALRGLAPQLHQMCRQLAGYNLPDTLAHGDYHANNAAIRDGQLIIFDWTDAAVSHPFFDLVLLASDLTWEAFAAKEGVRLYLEQWTAFEPMPRLWEALKLAIPLGAVYQMISYQGIIANLEPTARWENAGGLRYFVKFLLKNLNEKEVVGEDGNSRNS